MLFIVNCQNGFLEKCDSTRLRAIVEAAELLQPSRVIVWSTPPVEALGKKIGEDTRLEYDLALYPEIAQLNLPTSHITGLDKLPKEFYQEIQTGSDVLICGCNVQGWIVKIALEMWNVARIRPGVIREAWFTIGPKGSHSDAMTELVRHFGAGTLRDWPKIRAPLVRARAGLVAAMQASKKEKGPEEGVALE
jgi:hypothetical protein